MTVPVLSPELGFVPIVSEMLDRGSLAGDDGVYASGVELARALSCHARSSAACVFFFGCNVFRTQAIREIREIRGKIAHNVRFWFGEDKEIADHLMTKVAELGELDRAKFGVQK